MYFFNYRAVTKSIQFVILCSHGAVHQQRSNIRVVLLLFFISASNRVAAQAIISLMQQIIHLHWLLIMCHQKPKKIHTSLQPLQNLTSLIRTLEAKVEKLIIDHCALLFWWWCVQHHTYCTLYGVFMFSCSDISFSHSASILHTLPQV